MNLFIDTKTAENYSKCCTCLKHFRKNAQRQCWCYKKMRLKRPFKNNHQTIFVDVSLNRCFRNLFMQHGKKKEFHWNLKSNKKFKMTVKQAVFIIFQEWPGLKCFTEISRFILNMRWWEVQFWKGPAAEVKKTKQANDDYVEVEYNWLLRKRASRGQLFDFVYVGVCVPRVCVCVCVSHTTVHVRSGWGQLQVPEF